MKKSGKGQVQMGETIAVLLVFFILVLIGFVFYTKIAKSNIEAEQDEQRQLKAIEVAQKASFLPEVQCSEENIITDNCIDFEKLNAAKDIVKDNGLQYFDILGFSNITIFEIYPGSAEFGPGGISVYERPLGNFTSKSVTNVPIAIFYPKERKHHFAVMKVEVYER